MSELRKDPVIGRWVIISTERGKRPSEFHQCAAPVKSGFCPFCIGNEEKTPPTIVTYRDEDNSEDGDNESPDWNIRIVANKFPALKVEGELNRAGDGLYDMMNGIGAHEIIIESPNHSDTLATITVQHFEDILRAYRDRIVDLKKDKRLSYILIFKNHGEAAGASLEHSHSQLIALPIIPKRVAEEIDGALAYYRYKERCVFCDIIRQEISQKKRIVTENHDFLAVTPYAPKAPFEVWILPKFHEPRFEDSKEGIFESLSLIFSDVLKRLNKVLNSPPYNFVLHTSPTQNNDNMDHYHWHFEIMPKLTKTAGFEWGSGFYIIPTPPEEAAEFLRQTKVD